LKIDNEGQATINWAAWELLIWFKILGGFTAYVPYFHLSYLIDLNDEVCANLCLQCKLCCKIVLTYIFLTLVAHSFSCVLLGSLSVQAQVFYELLPHFYVLRAEEHIFFLMIPVLTFCILLSTIFSVHNFCFESDVIMRKGLNVAPMRKRWNMDKFSDIPKLIFLIKCSIILHKFSCRNFMS